jgi:predicted unusual protein kinase regulating ubiquinone biosynthesis (AarF/ABC1/UbiB family)
MADEPDRERNRLTGRISRYARVGANVGGAAVQMATARLFGRDLSDPKNAALLVQALGGLKGPVMKMAQLAATIPDMLPPEYAAELQTLQASAPPMGPSFVKRRMMVELGAGWEKKFASFDREPAAAASLGQVHRAVAHDGRALACKLQYPDMESAVAADLGQLNMILGLQRRFSPEIDTSEIAKEIGERLKEELDYTLEARHIALYRQILAGDDLVRVPEPVPALSTKRLLTMSWLEGTPLLSHKEDGLEDRNRISEAVFHAWWHPFARFGVIHGDPHLGNYTVFNENGRPGGLNLLDYGCIRIFPAGFVEGVIELYHGLRDDEPERVVHAYEGWGFQNLTKSTIDTLNIWARFIYAPLLDDRVRTIADGVEPQLYGRREVWEVKQRLKPESAITIPREFVLMDRAAIGIGSVFLHLRAEMNFHRLFEDAIADFSAAGVAKRQAKALKTAGLAG